MFYYLPDGTQIEDFASVRWSYTMEEQNHNWEQWRQTFDAAVGLGLIVALVADDAVGGFLNDGFIVVILEYLSEKAPYAYEYILQELPQLLKFTSSLNSACPQGA